MQQSPQVPLEACPTPARTAPFEQQVRVFEERRFLAIPFTFDVAGGSYQFTTRIPIGFDFVVHFLNAYFETDVFLQIRDDFRTEFWFIEPIRISLVSGDGRLPFALPVPYQFNAGTSITVFVEDPRTGTPPTARVEVVLIGFKQFKGTGAAGGAAR